MHKTRELKIGYLPFQLSVSATVVVAVLLLLLSLLLLYSSSTSMLSQDNDHIALGIRNTFNITDNTSLTSATNHPPVANAGPNQLVNENTTVALVGAGIDSDSKDTLSYLWRQTDGPGVILSNRSSTNPTFISPIVPSDTELKFSLTVTDDKGATSSPAGVTVIIKHINRPPVANAGINQTVNEGYAVTLDGTASRDPDIGDSIKKYSWMQSSGPSITLNDADTSIATFTAPSNLSSDIELLFKLTVEDNKNATNSDDVKVTIKHVAPPNQPPTANAGVDQTVNSESTVKLDGTASNDPDGSITSYSWVQTGGPAVSLNGADMSTPSFTAPNVSSDTQLKFSLTVKDSKGASSVPTFVTITVKAAAQAPAPLVTSLPSNVSTTEETSASSKEEYSFVRAWGSEGTENGQFRNPLDISIDSQNNVYVADLYNNRIQKFTTDGTFITSWGSYGSENGQFSSTEGIASDSSGNVYVADGNSDTIQKFTSDGTFITKWGSEGSGEGQFDFPYGIAIDSSGNVYVTDINNNRIQKFTTDGTFITSWGSYGTENGQFSSTEGIASDSSGNVYVADSGNDRIQKFTSDGTFITKWGSEGSGEGQFDFPYGIAIDSSGNVYVADTGNGRIQKFTADGTFITSWGSEGSAEDRDPRGIAIDSSGNVYVADYSNNRIQVFAPIK